MLSVISNRKKKFKNLYDTYSELLFVVALRYVSNQFDAEEVIQRGFIKAYKSLNKFRGKTAAEEKAWLKRIMINESLLFLREQKRHLVTELTIESDWEEELEEEALNPELCFQLVKDLPDGYRSVFNLNVIEGYSHKEIAEELGISESTSRSQLQRARKLLQSKIKHYETAHRRYI
ncbi:sigma-70 family RNA polymerase sigma factor [Prolixibacteraceae bacterium JC049]|nr:sigma-70 family RNA polymerase sigma factor [Prolixibacteraceae bacterium JC049]